MTIGAFQTVARDSLFTRLDFRTKLLMIVVVTGIAFIWESPLLGGGLAFIVLLTCLFAGVSFAYIWRVVAMTAPFYLIMILTQALFAGPLIAARTGQDRLTMLLTFPEHWWLIGGSGFSREGLLYAANVVFKTLTMTLIIPLGIFTTDINKMVVSMVRLKIPYRFVFIFSSTLRFFPLLFQEAHFILEAQRLRGLALEEIRGIKRLNVYARIAIPLILNTMVKSQMLEVVLQSKAFPGDANRTYLHESRLGKADYILIGALSLFFVTAIISYFVFGLGKFGGPA